MVWIAAGAVRHTTPCRTTPLAYTCWAIASACSRVSSMPCSSLAVLLRLGDQLILVLRTQRSSTRALNDFLYV
jgi:hypothetical protein